MLKTIFLLLLFFVSLYSRTLEDIKSSKVLKVAMRQNDMTYSLQNDKIVANFDYALALEFGKYLGAKIELVHVDSFKSFWLKDGNFIFKLPAPSTPDIFKKADMTLDIISINKTRLKHINMVPYIQNKSIIFTNKNRKMKKIEDLVGKKILLFDGMQSQIILKKELEKRKIPIKVFYVSFDKKKNDFIGNKIDNNSVNMFLIEKKTKMPFLSVYFAVFKGDVDAASGDTFALFQKLQKYTYLKGDLYPSFSLEKEMGYLGGTMPKNSKNLRDEFAKFIEISKQDGTLNTLMLKYLSIDLKSYNQIVEYNAN
jgi:ABC-type amino acid transport substrate-binding protein